MDSSICSWNRSPIFKIFRSVPAAQIVRAQVGVKPLDEGLIVAGAADETRIEFNRLSDQGSGIGDELFGHTTPAQEGFGNGAAGFEDGVNPHAGGASVDAGFQTLCVGQIRVRKNGSQYSRTREVRPVEAGSAEVYHDDLRLTEVRHVEVGPVEVDSADGRPAQVGLVQVQPGEAPPTAKVHPAEVGNDCPIVLPPPIPWPA